MHVPQKFYSNFSTVSTPMGLCLLFICNLLMLLAKYCTNNYPYELLTNEASKYLAQCSEFVTCCWRSTLIIGWKLREIALYFEKLLECPYLCTLETHEMLHQWVSCHHYVGIFLSLRPFTQWNWETSYSFSKWHPSFSVTVPLDDSAM